MHVYLFPKNILLCLCKKRYKNAIKNDLLEKDYLYKLKTPLLQIMLLKQESICFDFEIQNLAGTLMLIDKILKMFLKIKSI